MVCIPTVLTTSRDEVGFGIDLFDYFLSEILFDYTLQHYIYYNTTIK